MGKLNNVISVSTSPGVPFFKQWLKILKPLHTLTEREMEVLAAILWKRQELSKSISDPDLLDKVLLSTSTRSEIMDKCNISKLHIQVIYNRFKKIGVIQKGRLNPRYIPNIAPDDTTFQLLFLFDLNDK